MEDSSLLNLMIIYKLKTYPQIIKLSEINQTEKDKYDITYMWSLENTTIEHNKKEADSQIQRTNWGLAVGNTGVGNGRHKLFSVR